jgi:aminoglycoside 6-adenylyltransferase
MPSSNEGKASMIATHEPRAVIDRLVRWADRHTTVRAMLLTSSRAAPGAHVDIFSDYDVVLVMTDIRPYVVDRSWLQDFGQVLVAYWDPISPEAEYGIEQTGNVTYFADGLHIDFRLWPVILAQRIARAPVLPPAIDAGYSVLVDKDQLTVGMRAPTYRAYIRPRPTEALYQTWIEEFFSDAPYVAKYLWRDELLPAKWCLDCDMKQKYLLQMLEWRMERDHGWSAPTGNLGKGLKQRLLSELWRALEDTYVGGGITENWEALFRTMALFRRVAIEVADDLGYTYPLDLDDRVTAYVRTIQDTAHGAT